MKKPSLTLFAALAGSFLLGCNTPPGQAWVPTAGVSTLVLDNYDATIGALGYGSFEFDVEASAFEIQAGATRVADGPRNMIKHEFVGAKLVSGEVDDGFVSIDADQVAGGGLWYFDSGEQVVPYLSLWSVLSSFDIPGLSSQLSIEIGGGAEIAINDGFAFFAEAGLLIPINDAQYSNGDTLEIGGLGGRVGIRALLDAAQ